LINLYRVIDNLIKLVENKYEYLKDIYLLTQQQTEVIEESDVEALSELIDKKQQKIDFVQGLDSQFEAITDDLKTIYEIKSLDELEIQCENIGVLKNIISKVTEILHQIIQIENVNKEKMNFAKHQLEIKMSNAKTGKTAVRQYSGISTYADAVFFDKKIR